MPRAHRHYVPGVIWHVTHRCHKQAFLLRFARDRARWRYWLYQAKKRYGLCVLNYMVTSNHIHLLVRDTSRHAILKSMQLIAGRTAQEYNQRKNRKGAFWEDRYHATAVQSDEHFYQCQVYIDLNMVRAGVGRHPSEWPHCGYNEIQSPPVRYQIIDKMALQEITGTGSYEEYQRNHSQWLDSKLSGKSPVCYEEKWTESVAVGDDSYVANIKSLSTSTV